MPHADDGAAGFFTIARTGKQRYPTWALVLKALRAHDTVNVHGDVDGPLRVPQRAKGMTLQSSADGRRHTVRAPEHAGVSTLLVEALLVTVRILQINGPADVDGEPSAVELASGVSDFRMEHCRIHGSGNKPVTITGARMLLVT